MKNADSEVAEKNIFVPWTHAPTSTGQGKQCSMVTKLREGLQGDRRGFLGNSNSKTLGCKSADLVVSRETVL